MSKPLANITGILLAGGKSRRMGRDKRFVQLEGASLFQRTLDVLTRIFEHVIVVVGKKDPAVHIAFSHVVEDIIPNCGSAGGLYTGLSHALTDRAFVAACDMPFLNHSLVEYLCNLDPISDVVMVKLGNKLQPLHAVYSKRCLSILECSLEQKDYKIQNLCACRELAINIVPEELIRPWDPYGLSFMNINTPMDLEFAQKFIRREKPSDPVVE